MSAPAKSSLTFAWSWLCAQVAGNSLDLNPPAVQRITRFPPSAWTQSIVRFHASSPNVGVRVRVR
jgi:hypothetical protein